MGEKMTKVTNKKATHTLGNEAERHKGTKPFFNCSTVAHIKQGVILSKLKT